MPTPKALIEQLLLLDMNEYEIAAELSSSGVPVTQATINRIRNGRIKRTSYDIGTGLQRLLDTRSKLHTPVGQVA
jgi:hypothetical protein